MCEYCHQSVGHDPSCPEYRQEASGRCALCGEPICSGESIILTEGGPLHYDCFKETPTVDLLDLLGLKTTIA